jgi:two-component system LytT family response regulator
VRAVVVDDEELARAGLTACLQGVPGVDVVAACRSGREALGAIARYSPEVVFLDVEMPGTDGLGVIEAVGGAAPPYFVLVTAHERYAVRAFEVSVIDYLLKPVCGDRVRAAVKRVEEALSLARDGGLGRQVTALLRDTSALPGRADRFAVRSAGRVVFVRTVDVDWVGAQGDYVGLHVGKREHLLRETLASLERSLDPRRFVRIHRSTIVNVESITELRPHDNGEYVVVLRDGTELKLSRNYRDPLQARVAGRL